MTATKNQRADCYADFLFAKLSISDNIQAFTGERHAYYLQR